MNKNKYEYIFFDLDGTLLNLDTDELVSTYFKSMTVFLAKNGFDAEKVVAGIKSGTYAMISNNGTVTNEIALTNAFLDSYECNLEEFKKLMDEYYYQKFDNIKSISKFEPETLNLIKKLKENGYKLILATNPLFPRVATLKRIAWAGLDADDFEIITTYENESFAKPNLKYYKSLLERIKVPANSCLMVGNDVDEDMCASELGFDVFLITTNLLNRKNKDISKFNQGSLNDFKTYIFN